MILSHATLAHRHTHMHTNRSCSQPPDLMIFPVASVNPCLFNSRLTNLLVPTARPEMTFHNFGSIPQHRTIHLMLWAPSSVHGAEPLTTHPNKTHQFFKFSLQALHSCCEQHLSWCCSAGLTYMPEEHPENIFSVGCLRDTTYFKLTFGCQGMNGL